MGELTGKDDISAQVINHVHVEVLPVSGPPVSTDPARVDGVDVVGEVVVVFRQEGFVEDVPQYHQIALRQNEYRLFGIEGLISHIKLSGHAVLFMDRVQQAV